MPLHPLADTGAGIPWLFTTSPAFPQCSASQPNPAFQRFSLTTSCPASKRNPLAALFGGSGTCKLPELVVNDVLGSGLTLLDFTMSYMPTSVPYVPYSVPSPPQPPTLCMEIGTDMAEISDDPVAKAVMENVFPNKKPKVTVRCDACNLEFFSQAVLDSHLTGSKHQRKVKSLGLMKTLEETETGFERDEVSGVIRCIVCDVTVNSPQLLATHIAGNKHKQKAAKRSGDSGSTPPAKRPCPGVTGQVSVGQSAVRHSNGGPQNHQANNSSLAKGANAKAASSLDIPDCVTKLEDTKGGGKYLCNPCQAHCNSEQQLSQHLLSKKHIDKLSGKKPKGAGGGGGWRGRRRPSFRGRPSWRGRGRTHTYTQPLSSNFVAGGALL
ncbi:Zinc finger protein 385D [Chionoecetes opilio]|uniref:Zinc finger protein 385D n=1 Tax=Chionoecetes opilio TaxID=41210 RepID=A0A8J4XUV1_CHIOP|nr:Zinc finger protein 385D [Chionoecetes opilio]